MAWPPYLQHWPKVFWRPILENYVTFDLSHPFLTVLPVVSIYKLKRWARIVLSVCGRCVLYRIDRAIYLIKGRNWLTKRRTLKVTSLVRRSLNPPLMTPRIDLHRYLFYSLCTVSYWLNIWMGAICIINRHACTHTLPERTSSRKLHFVSNQSPSSPSDICLTDLCIRTYHRGLLAKIND